MKFPRVLGVICWIFVCTANTGTVVALLTVEAPGTFVSHQSYGSVEYENSYSSAWLLMSPPEQYVLLSFTNFSVEYGSSCAYDVVTVYDGNSTNGQLLAKYCGESIPDPVQSTGNQMYVMFTTDSSVQRLGFEAQVNITAIALTGDVKRCKITPVGKEYIGSVATTRCGVTCQRWDSQSPHKHGKTEDQFPGKNITTASNYCRNPDNEPYGPWCYTTSNVRWDYCDIKDCKTNESTHGIGASSDGTERSCNETTHTGTVTALVTVEAPGTFVSHVSYGSVKYENYYESSWLLIAPPEQYVLLSFTKFSVEYHGSCEYDSLTLYDGNTANDTVLAKYCGDTIPDPVQSTTNQIFVLFITDRSTQDAGFEAQVNTTTIPKSTTTATPITTETATATATAASRTTSTIATTPAIPTSITSTTPANTGGDRLETTDTTGTRADETVTRACAASVVNNIVMFLIAAAVVIFC